MKIKKFDSINVIPFIDVLLVLLAIVLMTSTFIAKGIIPVSLPQASNMEDIKVKKELLITIQKEGLFYIEKKLVSKKKFEENIRTYSRKRPIHISSDKETKFEDFVFILDILKKIDYQNISIVTKK